MIYFDNAATGGKKPIQVIKATADALRHYSANPGRSGHSASQNTAFAIYKVREKLSDFFGGAGPERVIFTSGCTHSLNLVIKGTVKNGAKVVISDLEHNSVIRPLKKIGADINVARVSLDDMKKTLASFEALINGNTSLVICTAASNVTGTALPITEIGKLCKRYSVPFAVDAAQAAGILSINMKEMGIDYLCVAPHKGLYAPMGIGVLIANKSINTTIIEGGTGTDSVNPIQPLIFPEGFESGTVNVPGIMGLEAGLEFVKRLGVKKIHRHELQLTDRLYKGLRQNDDIILYTPSPAELGYAPVLSFNIKHMNSNEAAALLDRRGFALRAGLHCAPTAHQKLKTEEIGTVRFCPSVFNNEAEVNSLLHTLKNVKKL